MDPRSCDTAGSYPGIEFTRTSRNREKCSKTTQFAGAQEDKERDAPISDVAEVDGLPQRSERVASGDEFVSDVALVVGSGDAAHDPIPLDFLSPVEFMAMRNAAGMEVSDPVDIFLNGGDEVAFHDLHVVDVVEQFDPRRVDRLDNLKAPGGVVTHVVVMVDFAVEELDTDGDAVVFADFFLGDLAQRWYSSPLPHRTCLGDFRRR